MSDGQNITAVPAAQITVVDIFAKVIEMQATLAVIQEQLKAIPDHEGRLRALERFRFTLMGVAVSTSLAISGLGTWVGILITRH